MDRDGLNLRRVSFEGSYNDSPAWVAFAATHRTGLRVAYRAASVRHRGSRFRHPADPPADYRPRQQRKPLVVAERPPSGIHLQPHRDRAGIRHAPRRLESAAAHPRGRQHDSPLGEPTDGPAVTLDAHPPCLPPRLCSSDGAVPAPDLSHERASHPESVPPRPDFFPRRGSRAGVPHRFRVRGLLLLGRPATGDRLHRRPHGRAASRRDRRRDAGARAQSDREPGTLRLSRPTKSTRWPDRSRYE